MSRRSRVCSLDDALAGTADGTRVGIGGVLGRRRPLAACRALAATGCRDLHVWSFLAGAELEVLARCTASVTSGYLDPQAEAPATRRARDEGRIAWHEVSEQLFVGGLLAAANGLPFWPTLGAVGSALVDELGLREVACPYTGRPVLAAPASKLDLALVHADAATAAGAVLAPDERGSSTTPTSCSRGPRSASSSPSTGSRPTTKPPAAGERFSHPSRSPPWCW